MALVPFGYERYRRGKRADKIWYPIESPVIWRNSQIKSVMGFAAACRAATQRRESFRKRKKKIRARMWESLIMRRIRKSPRRGTGGVRVDTGDPAFVDALLVIRRRAYYPLGQRRRRRVGQPARLAVARGANRRGPEGRVQAGRLRPHGRRRAWSLRPGS